VPRPVPPARLPLPGPCRSWSRPCARRRFPETWCTGSPASTVPAAIADRTVTGALGWRGGDRLTLIAAMTTSQVTRRQGKTFIRLGRHDVPVPGPLADALRQLISGGRSYRGVGSPAATTWLFPGHLPGRPITPDTLGERLRALGIYAQTGRRAALLDLAARLPAAVLADLLGLHQNTAAKWMHQAGGDWSRYAAELARHPHQPSRIPRRPRPSTRGIPHGS
jgi:integrase